MAIAAARMPDPNDPRWRRNEQLERAQRIAKETNQNVMAVLLEMGIFGEREAQQARAQAMGMSLADLDRIRISPEMAELVTTEKRREWRALPLQRDRDTLWVAVENPDAPGIQRVKESTGLRVIPVLCVASALDEALAKLD